MTRHEDVAQWTATVREQVAHLSKPRATVLARGCALPAVATCLAAWTERQTIPSANNCGSGATNRRPSRGSSASRQWCVPASCRCCVGSGREPVGTQLALALGATPLGDRFVVVTDRPRRLAVAAHPHHRPGAGGMVVAGGDGGHPVAGAGGGHADVEVAEGTLADLAAALPTTRRPRRATRVRLGSRFRRGWTLIPVALLRHQPLPLGTLLPESWPIPPALALAAWVDST